MCIHVYREMCVCVCVCVYVYIYIYIYEAYCKRLDTVTDIYQETRRKELIRNKVYR